MVNLYVMQLLTQKDFSSFTDENFDLKAWINNALDQNKPPEESVEQHASTIVMKLQLISLELNNSLEEISVQALQSIPRAMREIEKVRREATELKKKIDGFNINLSTIEDNTVQSLLLISELDKVKSRIESVHLSLKEAEKLGKLVENIETAFTSANYQKIADELSLMSSSLEILHGIPEFNTNKKDLEKLQDRLETQVKPHLLTALQNHQTGLYYRNALLIIKEKSLQFVQIFTKINRFDHLLQYYYQCRKGPLENLWNSFDKKGANTTSFVKWLPTFYDEVLLEVREEASWASQIFTTEYAVVLPSLIAQIMSSFVSSFKLKISVYILNENNPTSLEDLISLYSITSSFSKTIQSVINYALPEAIENVVMTVFEPYFGYQNEYSQLEKKYLSKDVQKLKPNRERFSGTISNISEAIPKLFLLLENSVERCIKFTEGTEGGEYVKALSEIFEDFVNHLTTLLHYLREQAKLDQPKVTMTTVEHTPSYFDWSHFQGALQLLQIVNNFTTKLSNFDRNIRVNFVEQRNTILSKNGSEFKPLCGLHLRSSPAKYKKSIQFLQSLDDGRIFSDFSKKFLVALKLLPTPANSLTTFASSVHTLVFDSAFCYIKERLSSVPSLNKIWTSELAQTALNLPNFSLSPLTYITQIGDHLLTLPHQLEPFSSNDSSLFFDPKGLNNLNSMLDQNKDLNVTTDDLDTTTDSVDPNEEEEENKFAFQWISALGNGTMSLYMQKIMDIEEMTDHGAKQLATDISYLINVLAALGINADPNLENMVQLLSISRENYDVRSNELVDSQIGRMVANIRKIKIDS